MIEAMLSPHFSFRELTRTDNRLFLEKNADVPARLLPAARALARTILEPVRQNYGAPLVVHSGYRCPELNTAIGGSPTSQHPLFEATDFHIIGVTLEMVFDWIRHGGGSIPYGQVILEGHQAGKPTWLHLSLGEPFRPRARCREALVFDGKTYTRVPSVG